MVQAQYKMKNRPKKKFKRSVNFFLLQRAALVKYVSVRKYFSCELGLCGIYFLGDSTKIRNKTAKSDLTPQKIIPYTAGVTRIILPLNLIFSFVA